jgi:acyl-coenzyme A synthetase/AMP-(fatty) acid ligase
MSDFIYDRIRFFARLNPDAVAIHEAGREIRYARFVSDVNAVAARLHAEAGISRGQRVLVRVGVPYVHWLVVLACARLGIATASVSQVDDVALLKPDICIADGTIAALPGLREVRVTREWLTGETPAQENPDWPHLADDDLVRIVLSSGTTGRSKLIGITNAQLRDRAVRASGTYEFTTRTRCLAAVGIASLGGFQLPVAAWYCGGAVIIGGAARPLEAWRLGRPTFMMLPPGTLREALATLPAGVRPDPALQLIVAGAALPDTLNIQARLRITPNVYNVYGSTECSTVALCHAADCVRKPGNVGFVPPYMKVQVVDEHDQPLPDGREGALRVHGPGMATHYIDDEEATRGAFRDGWFYPGDAARIEPDRSVTITGRVVELMNMGGVKIAPDRVDDIVIAVPGVRDAATFYIAGENRLGIAVVPGEGFAEDVLMARYVEAFPKHPRPHVLRLDRVPRNEMGKVQRLRLAELAKQGKDGQ